MKILYVISYFQPKMGYQENFLPKEQIKLGHQVLLVTSDRYHPFPSSGYKSSFKALLGERKRGAGYKIEDGIPIYRLPILFEIRCHLWLRGLDSLILNLNPDLVISSSITPQSFRIAQLKSKGANFKLIVDSHEGYWREKGGIARGIAGKVYYNFLRKKLIKKILLPNVDKFIGTSPEACEFLEKDAVPKEKMKYIPLGTDLNLFKFNGKEREEQRAKLNVARNDILILYTGKIHKNKNIDVLIKALNNLDVKRKIYLLLISNADSKFKEEAMSLARKEIRNRIFFHPFVLHKQLPQYYSASDICIWPGTYSISMLDAMACGRPIIGYNAPGVRERVSNKNGLIYRRWDDKDLAEKIKYLVENHKLREEMGSRGRELAEQKYSWSKIAQDFVKCVMD